MSSAGNSPAGGPAAGSVPAFLRRNKQAVNPLMKKRPAASRAIGPQSNGAYPPRSSTPTAAVNGIQPQPQVQQPSSEPYERIPIITTKRQLIEGMRHHVIRFVPNASQAIQQVDLTQQSQFERPVRLHRRDPRDNKAYWEQEGATTDDGRPPLDDKERERLEALKALRKAEKEAIQAQIAPNATTVKRDRFKHRTEQVFQKAESKQHGVTMRYEEQIPWHVEDFSDKNIWQGQYEEPLSNCHVMFIPENDAQGHRIFRMVPLEKWYKFAPKSKNEIIKFEEAERRAATGVKPARWFMKRVEEQQKRAKAEPTMSDRMFKRTGPPRERDEDEEAPFGGSEGEEGADEMDFDHDEEFQDDDENALFEGDEEETKEAETRVKRDRVQANVFDVKEQKDWDAEEAAKKEREKLEKKKQKKTKKALLKREKNYIYDDDSDENPYASESSEDSEEEHIKEEEERKKREEEEAAAAKTTLTPPKSNTPSGRLEKKDPLRKSLKRPGSPNLSETSGNESSTTRKKMKKKHLQKSGLSNSANMSRATSPAGSQSSRLGTNGAARRATGGAAEGSDGEGSDNAPLKKQLKLKLNHGGSPGATPTGSRAGSPSAAGSPTDTATPPPGSKKQWILPTPEELIAAVPPEGLELRMLMKKFKSSNRHPDFGPFIKTHLSMRKKNIDGKDTPWLYHKGTKPSAASAAALPV